MKNWWPPGHIIGYEHGFVHAAADFLDAVAAKRAGAAENPITPDFRDGVRIARVLDAALVSAGSESRFVAVAKG